MLDRKPTARAVETRVAGVAEWLGDRCPSGGLCRAAILLVAVTGIEAVLAILGLLQGTGPFSISPIWPAAGFAIGVTFVYGYRVLPAIAVGESLASTWYGTPVLINAPLAVVAAGVGALGASLLRRATPSIGRGVADAREAVAFLVLAGVVTTAVSAVLGVSWLLVLDELSAAEAATTFTTWWLGDTVGVIVFAPFVLAFLPRTNAWHQVVDRLPEGAALIAATVVGTAACLAAGLAGDVPVIQGAVLPLLVWGALRFGFCGAASANVAMTATVTGASVLGLNLYGEASLTHGHSLQFLIAILSATNLVLGATVDRRNQLQREARREADFVQAIADRLPGAVFRRHLSPDGRLDYPFLAGRLANEYGLDPGDRSDILASDDERPPQRPGELDPHDRSRLRDALWQSARNQQPIEIDLRIQGGDGRMRWGRSISQPTPAPDGGTTWDGILLDVTAEKEQQERVEFLAHHDPLTGLLNRHGFHSALAPLIALARRRDERLAFCMIDLDAFKEINDSYGHACGDTVLETVGERIRAGTRVEDITARLGGDEFVVVQLNSADRVPADTTARRLLDHLSQVVRVGDHDLQPSVSMGIAFFPDHGNNHDAVMAAADEALYTAKTRERGNLVCYAPNIRPPRMYGSLELGQELAQAIDSGELAVYYQPQIALGTARVTGVEALARWHHPERGPIPPSEFVKLAENRGLATALDLHILRRALGDLSSWSEEVIGDLRVAVNLSGASVRDRYQRGRMAAALRETGLTGHRLELELTESTLVQAPDEQVGHALRELSDVGVRFAVDDFGTGYGSLTYLRSLPVDRIKIDRSFVQGAPYATADTEIVRALIQLGANLGLSVIAEGVEAPEHLAAARSLGCTDVQGYYFGKPMPAHELLALLQSDLQAI